MKGKMPQKSPLYDNKFSQKLQISVEKCETNDFEKKLINTENTP